MDYYTYIERGSEGWWPLPEGDEAHAEVDRVEILSAIESETNDVLPGLGFTEAGGDSLHRLWVSRRARSVKFEIAGGDYYRGVNVIFPRLVGDRSQESGNSS